jgi:glycyl-tRNA synthetase beta chain
MLVHGPERDLFDAFEELKRKIDSASSFTDKLALIATLRPKVDLFFDKILVNDPDPAVRENRLALLHGLLTEFSTIADFSEIVTQGVSA